MNDRTSAFLQDVRAEMQACRPLGVDGFTVDAPAGVFFAEFDAFADMGICLASGTETMRKFHFLFLFTDDDKVRSERLG